MAPTELVAGLTFVDDDGTRYADISLPRQLLINGSLAAKRRHLIATGQIPDPSAPPIPDPVEVVVDDVRAEQVDVATTAVEQLRAQLDEIQSKLDGQPLSHAELVAARQEIGDYLLKAADAAAQLVVVEGAGSRIRAELQAIADPLIEQSAETARQQAENVEVQARVLDALQAQANALLEALSADAAAAAVEAEAAAVKAAKTAAKSTAREVALAEVAKHWGSSVTIASEDPTKTDAESWAQRWYGRNFLIPGDGAMVTSESGVRLFRYTGSDWAQSAELSPKTELVNQQLSVLDQSTPTTVIQNISGGGGGGGGGGEPLLANRAALQTSVLVADASNWAGTNTDPVAGEILLEFTALDGSLASRRGFVAFDFLVDAANQAKWTQYALLGDLSDVVDVEVRIFRQTPTVPAGVIGIVLPGGLSATRVEIRLVPPVGGSMPDVTNFKLSGDVTWVHQSLGRAVDRNAAGIQPQWRWV